MMEIAGVRLFTIRDNDKSLIDIRVEFTAGRNGRPWALYDFGKKLSDKAEQTAQDAINASRQLRDRKHQVMVIGTDPDDPKEQRVAGDAMDLAPMGDAVRGEILIGKVEKGKFAVRVAITPKKEADKIILEVPFKGDPGDVKGKKFDGEVTQLASGTTDVAKLMVSIYEIGASDR